MKKNIVKGILFISIFFLILEIIEEKLDLKSESSKRVIEFYYDKRIDSEILTLGSSHILYGLDTRLIKENGKDAYNLAHTGQRIPQSYFLLKESIINNQIPKILIIDIFGAFLKRPKYDYMSFSKTDNGLRNLEIKKEYLEYSKYELSPFKIVDIHNNWKMLNKENIISGIAYEDTFKDEELYSGFFVEKEKLKSSNFNKLNKEQIKKIEEYYNINDEINIEELEYLKKIKKLCEDNSIELYVIKTPVINYIIEEEKYSKKISEPIEKYMWDNNLKYIDFNLAQIKEKINLNFKSDFLNNGHLNENGAKKITQYIINEII